MFCMNCGSQQDDDALFCINCGSKLEKQEVQTAKNYSSEIEGSDSINNSNEQTLQDSNAEVESENQVPESGAKVKQKLIENGLENYIPLFEENHLLDETVLSIMTSDDYVQIGVTIIGDRKKMQLLFDKAYKKAEKEISPSEQTKLSNVSPHINETEEFINVIKMGKIYCYKRNSPETLLCRKCHKEVSEESTLCWNCNSSLVVS